MSALRLASPASTSAPSSLSSSPSVVARASAPAAPAQLATAPFNGAAAPSVAPLSLQVAEADTASAVVHRYVVLLNQNARAVRLKFYERGENCRRRFVRSSTWQIPTRTLRLRFGLDPGRFCPLLCFDGESGTRMPLERSQIGPRNSTPKKTKLKRAAAAVFFFFLDLFSSPLLRGLVNNSHFPFFFLPSSSATADRPSSTNRGPPPPSPAPRSREEARSLTPKRAPETPASAPAARRSSPAAASLSAPSPRTGASR